MYASGAHPGILSEKEDTKKRTQRTIRKKCRYAEE
jgi:hypothetical protein